MWVAFYSVPPLTSCSSLGFFPVTGAADDTDPLWHFTLCSLIAAADSGIAPFFFLFVPLLCSIARCTACTNSIVVHDVRRSTDVFVPVVQHLSFCFTENLFFQLVVRIPILISILQSVFVGQIGVNYFFFCSSLVSFNVLQSLGVRWASTYLCDRCSSNYTVVLRLSCCRDKGGSHLGKWGKRRM